jgi:thiol:disulfide interchange protein
MKFFGLLFLICGLAQAQSKLISNFATHTVTTPHVRAELMALAPDGVLPGKPLLVGLQMQHQAGWHTYWKNPGDSGLPIQMKWTLPAGIVAGPIEWPVPKKIPVGNLANYGYEGTIFLPVALTVQEPMPEGQTHITVVLKAQWLVCKTECIPEEGEFALKIPIKGSTALSRSYFDNAKKSISQLGKAGATLTPQGQILHLKVSGLPASWTGKQLEAFPEAGEIIETAGKVVQRWQKDEWIAELPLSAHRSTSAASNPAQMRWLIKVAGGQSNPAVLIDAALNGVWPTSLVAEPAPASAALQAALANNLTSQVAEAHSVGWTSGVFWFAVLSAALGGLILNLMPCVLPVLAIKLLSFAPKKLTEGHSSVATIRFEHTQMPIIQSEETLSFRASSGFFAVGVVGSFVLLGVALLVLRAAGQSLGWGFQLQSPAMVMSLAVLFLLIGLNLLGAFNVGALVPAKLANFHSNNSSIEAIASGALAVVIATPCTAPFMGASLGLAVSLPALKALLIFTALGVGMALPFILLSMFPQMAERLLRMLPKPGAWMSVLRHFLVWPMFATVVWLLWIYAQQTSIDSAFVGLFSLLMLAALTWALQLRNRRLRYLTVFIFGLCLLLSITVPLGKTNVTQGQALWVNWSASAQSQARATGRPVFVDFTAAWCITCQVNKSSTLNSEVVQARFKAKNVLLLRADWTKPDAAIAAELGRLGRTGLPVYALYLPGSDKPQLLPEVLTTRILEDALSVL